LDFSLSTSRAITRVALKEGNSSATIIEVRIPILIPVVVAFGCAVDPNTSNLEWAEDAQQEQGCRQHIQFRGRLCFNALLLKKGVISCE
jgi:hypothetical protein